VDHANPAAYHGGDFQGIIHKIPYLHHLGVNVIWITPVYINITTAVDSQWGYHGYWTLDFEKVDPHWYSASNGIPDGSKAYVKTLADTLHAQEMKLILDVIVNHTGYNHPGQRGDPTTPIQPHWFNPPNQTTETEKYLYGLPDLDHDQAEVADYFVNNILDWLDATGVDGIRMDAVKHVERAFWYHFKNYVRGRYPDVSVIAEVLDLDVDRVSRFQRYFAFDSLFDFPLQEAIRKTFIYNHSMNLIARPRLQDDEPKGILDKDTLYTNHNRLIIHLDNHDSEQRFFSEALAQCHGDRDHALNLFKLATTFLLTTRGIPQLYYGTEIAMEGQHDPDNRRDMPWHIFQNGLEPATTYHVEKHAYDHVHKLITLRNTTTALQYASLLTLYADYFVYAYLREFRGDHVIVVINNGRDPIARPPSPSISDRTSTFLPESSPTSRTPPRRSNHCGHDADTHKEWTLCRAITRKNRRPLHVMGSTDVPAGAAMVHCPGSGLGDRLRAARGRVGSVSRRVS